MNESTRLLRGLEGPNRLSISYTTTNNIDLSFIFNFSIVIIGFSDAYTNSYLV